jgi:phage tail P2-like protein
MPELLPPSSTPLERAFAGATDRIAEIPIDVAALWDPARCPIALLPWLAWTLSTDHWDPNWSDAEKRAAVASAIADQRIKGTRYSVEHVLSRIDGLLELTEWFEARDRLEPHTFEVLLPLIDDGVVGGRRGSAEFAQQIIDDVSRAKPVREHLILVQQLELAGGLAPIGAVRAAGYVRLDLAATDGDPAIDWHALLTDDIGEPLLDDEGNFLEFAE